MNPYITEAAKAWAAPKTVRLPDGTSITVPNKANVLNEAVRSQRIPTAEEEQDLGLTLEAVGVDRTEWGAICLLADRLRRNRATEALADEASEQVAGASRFLDLGADDFLHWPFADLDRIVGGMAPGTLHFVVCPSKGGKTTLCRSSAAHWIGVGKRVYYAGLEMKATTLRTMYAADDVGVDPGDVLSGAWLKFQHYHELRARMAEAYKQQDDPKSAYQNLRFSGFDRVNQQTVRDMLNTAHDWGADVVIIDHVDHIGGTSKNEFSASLETCHLLLELAKKWDLTLIITSQTNRTNKANDKFRDHRPLTEEVIKFGGHKTEVATTITGFYRPVDPRMTKEDRQMVERGQRSVGEFLWRGVNAANLMASRTYGSQIGQRALLGWDRGRIVDLPDHIRIEQQARDHGIKTNRDL